MGGSASDGHPQAPSFADHIWGLHTPRPHLSPQDALPKPAHCSELFLATLALKSTCILNLKPSNYLYLQRNRKIDFAIVMRQAAVASVGWSAYKNWDPLGTYKARLGTTAGRDGEGET